MKLALEQKTGEARMQEAVAAERGTLVDERAQLTEAKRASEQLYQKQLGSVSIVVFIERVILCERCFLPVTLAMSGEG